MPLFTTRNFISLLLLAGNAAVHAEPTSTALPPATAAAPATSAPAPAPAPVTPQVSRATFTSGISGREPVDHLEHATAGQSVYYFTELLGLQGHVVTHKWEKDGQFQLGLQFPVGGQRWRVHSSKTLPANLPGTWTITVQNDDGSILRQDTLIVDPAASDAPTPAPTPAESKPATAAPSTPIAPMPAPVTTTPSAPTVSMPAEVKPIPTPLPLTTTPTTEAKPEPPPATGKPAEKEEKAPDSTSSTPTSDGPPIWENLPR